VAGVAADVAAGVAAGLAAAVAPVGAAGAAAGGLPVVAQPASKAAMAPSSAGDAARKWRGEVSEVRLMGSAFRVTRAKPRTVAQSLRADWVGDELPDCWVGRRSFGFIPERDAKDAG